MTRLRSAYAFGTQVDSPRDSSQQHPHRREGARRVLNVVVATVGIVAAAPIMVVVACAVKLSSPGPILFRQKRVGLDLRSARGESYGRHVDIGGRPFTILKFRTMRVGQPGQAAEVWAAEGDPRITPVGQFLRRTRLDELPQLFNVIRGDMNVVGPRPEQPAIFQNLRTEVPNYRARQQVRPGITGLAQITLQYDSCVDDVRKKVAADLEYIESQSLVQDLRIMAMTAPVMLFRKGSR
jgi:lipopolysaccharide/colanic/teichoic acid biosynthesis glycosyltransferase